MSDYKYPANDLDRTRNLLAVIGSYWSETYRGNDLIQTALFSKAQNTAQTHLDFLELIASISRFDVPVFHTENWHFLTFKESELNNFEDLLPKYSHSDPPGAYKVDSGLQYNKPVARDYSVALPKHLIDFKVALNRITESSLTLIKGIDYHIPEPGILTFPSNPFDNELIPKKLIWKNGVVVDREAGLWLFRGKWDWDTVYSQFGSTINLRMKSSEGYKQLINAIFDAIIEGTKLRDIQFAWSAITGIPLTIDTVEVVELVTRDANSEVIITDQNAYTFPLGSTPLVAAGDTLNAGDPLVDTLQFFEFNRGEVPVEIRSLAIGPGFLATGFWGDLVWESKLVDVVVELNVNGHTKVSWELGGFPADVEKFWDDVHTKGVLQGKTLAQMLDIRSDPPEEPGPASLPATINPLEFLCKNLLRYHTYAVKVRTNKMGKSKLGLHAAVNLRRIVPPHTAMIVLVELEHQDEPITMNGPGSDLSPGYMETVSGFPVMAISETITPDMILEQVRIYQIAGKCE